VSYRLATANTGTVVVAGAINKAADQGADAVGGSTFLDFDEFVPAGSNTFAVFTVVPVPAAAWLFISALTGLGLLRRH